MLKQTAFFLFLLTNYRQHSFSGAKKSMLLQFVTKIRLLKNY